MISTLLGALGYEIRRIRLGEDQRGVPGYLPWVGEDGEFERHYRIAEPRTLVSIDRCYVLYRLLQQARHVAGDIWECGVYHGGTAAMLASAMAGWPAARKLVLFDTFEGMPETDAEKDLHRRGDFAESSLEAVRRFVGHDERCEFRAGRMPETFAGLEASRIALAHVDVDIYRSVMDCLEFIWPRLSPGGFIVLDDYGFPSCPGAKLAANEFFTGKPAVPLCLPTLQGLVFKGA